MNCMNIILGDSLELKGSTSVVPTGNTLATSAAVTRKKKKKRINLRRFKVGRWDEDEHKIFKYAFMIHGNDWKSVIIS